MELKQELNNLVDALVQQRDELRVQINLAQKDVRDEWDDIEGKLESIRSKADLIGDEVGDSSKDVLEAVKLVADEVKTGFDRIRKVL